MDSPWPENLAGDRRNRAIAEGLIRGREFANQLRALLGRPPIGYGGVAAEDLVEEVLRSFTGALALLNRGGESEEVASRVPKSFDRSRLNSPCSDGGRRSEDSGESCKSSSALKGRKGCYRKRKAADTWTRTTATLFDDGHAWRKYGQKVILNAKHPRSYYRCTHKFDQGCQATKQVQRAEGEAELYQITYNGHHTCSSAATANQILHIDSDGAPPPHHYLVLDEDHVVDAARSHSNRNAGSGGGDDHSSSNSILLSFQSKPRDDDHDHDDHPFFASFRPSLIKREYGGCGGEEEEGPILCDGGSLPSDHHGYLFSHDLVAASDQGDVVSRTASSTHSLDMDVMVGSVDFSDDVLQFEF